MTIFLDLIEFYIRIFFLHTFWHHNELIVDSHGTCSIFLFVKKSYSLRILSSENGMKQMLLISGWLVLVFISVQLNLNTNIFHTTQKRIEV